jgi:hypothetical protein
MRIEAELSLTLSSRAMMSRIAGVFVMICRWYSFW